VLSKNDLRTLLEHRAPSSVSIYMPTHPIGDEVQQDPIRLRNLLDAAERQLIEGGARSPDAHKLLAPAQELTGPAEFWRQGGRGLALYLAPGEFHAYRLPLEFEALAVVTERFHIKPLLPLFTGDGRFLVLALSQNQVRLLEGTRYNVGEIDLPDVPKNLEAALERKGIEAKGRELQFHTPTAPGWGRRAAVFHQAGTADEKDWLREYFRQIDAGLREMARDEPAPLVLAGVDYLLPIYREVSDYPTLVPEGITGNPETTRADELRARGWEVMRPRFAAAREQAAEEYRRLAGAGSKKASDDLEEIVSAAYHGRVQTLFVALEVQQWGDFDADRNEVTLHDKQAPGDQDLLDFAAVHTYLNGGTVYAVRREAAPDGAPVSAVFRY
jgi:hypothetical protein